MATYTNIDIQRVFDTPANLATVLINGQFGYDTSNDRIAVKRLADGTMKYFANSTDDTFLNADGTQALTGNWDVGDYNITNVNILDVDALTVTASMSMSSKNITNVLDPVANQDAATKAYVDAKVTAEDLDFRGDTGSGSIDLDSEILGFVGTANQIVTAVSGNTVTAALATNVSIPGTGHFTGAVTMGSTLGVTGVITGTSTLYVQPTNSQTDYIVATFFNQHADGGTRIFIKSNGVSSDSMMQLTTDADGTPQNWAIGVDGSDSDKLKIGPHYLLNSITSFVMDTTGAVTMGSTLGVASTVTLSTLTASRLVFTNASKQLISDSSGMTAAILTTLLTTGSPTFQKVTAETGIDIGVTGSSDYILNFVSTGDNLITTAGSLTVAATGAMDVSGSTVDITSAGAMSLTDGTATIDLNGSGQVGISDGTSTFSMQANGYNTLECINLQAQASVSGSCGLGANANDTSTTTVAKLYASTAGSGIPQIELLNGDAALTWIIYGDTQSGNNELKFAKTSEFLTAANVLLSMGVTSGIVIGNSTALPNFNVYSSLTTIFCSETEDNAFWAGYNTGSPRAFLSFHAYSNYIEIGNDIDNPTIRMEGIVYMREQKEIRFYDSSDTYYTALKAGSPTSDTTFILPIADATTSGQPLTSDASGNLSFNNNLVVSNKLIATPDEITSTSEGVAASISTLTTEITTNGDSDLDNVTLANGTSGQIKYFAVVAVGNAADSVKITPATMVGGTQITFAASPLGLGCIMQYADNEGWVVIGNNGGTIS